MSDFADFAHDALVAANVAHAALIDAGRPDLAALVQFFVDDDGGPYIEPMEALYGDDLALVERAERLALEWLERETLGGGGDR